MPKRDLTLTSKLILSLHVAEDMMMPFVSRKDWYQRTLTPGSHDSFRAIIYRLEKRGLLKFIEYKEDRFIKLTKKGQLEALMLKARLPIQQTWDGKWRLIIFDIPEDAHLQRDYFRRMLKTNNFIKLQASVFISPFALNREAIEYLKQTNLIEYIRILRVDGIDKDEDLKKHFGLKKI